MIVVVGGYGSKACLEEERAALLNYKSFLRPHGKSVETSLSSWVNDRNSDCCEWERVTCDPASRRVIHLSLHSLLHVGASSNSYEEDRCLNSLGLDFSMFKPFKELRSLDLSLNCFNHSVFTPDFKRVLALKKLETLDLSCNTWLDFDTSSIFKSLSALKSLRILALRGTLTGPLAAQDSRALSRLRRLQIQDVEYAWENYFANLSNVEVLILRGNYAHHVPIKGLCRLKKLQGLDLSGNNLTGSLALFSCLENLTSLRALDLSRNHLSGNISSSFVAKLASLEYLSLSDNNLEGTFPLSSLANNSKLKVLRLGGMHNKNFQVETESPPWIPSFQLEYLDMADCQMNLATRTIPTFLSYQRGLRYIDLANNNLIGRFPNWLLVNNPKLEGVFLNNNCFNGSFLLPSEKGEHMDHLYTLDISHNRIQGKLPETLGLFFPSLAYLNASSNVLDGDIPASIGEMNVLKALDLVYNNLSGELPNNMLRGCTSLLVLRLSHNSFRGQILPTPLSMVSLRVLEMGSNQFDGTLQDGLLSIPYLRVLDISNNKLSRELPRWVGSLKLEIVSVSGNDFEGATPTELCKLEDLIFVSLSHNRFSGAIPSCLGMSSSLQFIHLQKNSLIGTIPESLLRSSGLVSLDLGDNNISGSIPKSVNGLASLKFLSLGGNRLHGQLPREICELEELNFLDLSRNNFSGSIPTCFNNISFGNEGYHYDFLFNYFRVSYFGLVSTNLFHINYQYPRFDLSISYKDVGYLIPEEMHLTTKGTSLSYKGNILNYMSGLDLSFNQLAGKIPQQIGDLNALHALNLSHNYLDGSIPKNFLKLKMIESLDLSFNKLNGSIPLELQDLNSLAVFNVSCNNLSGRAPDKGQFATFDERSYKGNPYLSWNITNRGTATPPPPPWRAALNDGENNSAIEFTSFCWTFGASYVMAVLMFI